jgi:hypothetical protein
LQFCSLYGQSHGVQLARSQRPPATNLDSNYSSIDFRSSLVTPTQAIRCLVWDVNVKSQGLEIAVVLIMRLQCVAQNLSIKETDDPFKGLRRSLYRVKLYGLG